MSAAEWEQVSGEEVLAWVNERLARGPAEEMPDESPFYRRVPSDLERVMVQIADRFGGAGCRRGWVDRDELYRFTSEDGMVYRAYAPGVSYAVYEDSGRPAGRATAPAGKVVVRCVNDAPDALFHVDVETGQTS